MIGTRIAVALCLLLAVAGVVVGTAGFVLAVRDDGNDRGRLVQTRLNATYDGEPVLFPLDDFYFGRGEDGRMHALYLYPPGYFGHVRGCRVVWLADDPEAPDGAGGRFVDPCGGARFSASGQLISGPADRGLDYFDTSPDIDGIVVDTRTLFCGEPFRPATPVPTEAPLITPVVVTPPVAGITSSPSATPTATPSPSPTTEPTPADETQAAAFTATAEAMPRECDRVSADAER